MRGGLLAVLAATAAASAFPATADAGLRIRGRAAGRRLRTVVRVPSALFDDAGVDEDSGGATLAARILAASRR